MNDRYLYRAKRTDNGGWVSGYLYGIWERKYILWGMINDVPDMKEVDPYTICQCTGLNDKNGKLIFEHDIVKLYCDKEPYLIDWSEDNAKWQIDQYGSCIYDFEEYSSCEFEVIGNIFDNPELFEVGE